MTVKEYLDVIDKTISDGEYKDNWQSLCKYGLPDWYKNSKLGIFIHWGVYSVPAHGNEWYPRRMYQKSDPLRAYHIKKYGKNFDYSQFIDMFKAEKFNADEWVKMFKDMGADFLLPVGEHHDGFKMFGSELSPFNSVQMGPHRDVLGELKAACEKQDMIFTTSSHFAERWFYYNGARLCGDNEITRGEKPELYGEAFKPSDATVKNIMWYDDTKFSPSKEWLEKWLANTCEMIDKYQPEALWFDWWVSHKAFKPYMRKMAAYYYNRSLEWGKKVCIQSKFDSVAFGQGIYDRERGQLDGTSPFIWQCETSTSYSSWGYTDDSKFKTAAQIICNYIDVVSKNGVFVLNFGPKADGTFCDEEKRIAREMSDWLKIHGSIIRNARPYRIYGEGKKRKSGSFVEKFEYTSKDFRFLFDSNKLYIFVLKESPKNTYRIKSLPADRNIANYNYLSAKVAGSDAKVTLAQKPKYLEVTLSKNVRNDGMPICIELEIE